MFTRCTTCRQLGGTCTSMRRGGMIALAGLFVVALATSTTRASTVIFTHDVQFSSTGTDPLGSTPWIKAVVTDTGTDTVNLTITTPGLIGTEFMDSFYMNLKLPLLATNLTTSYQSGITASVSKGNDAFKADGDGLFDLLFSFPTQNTSPRFVGGNSSVWTISGAGLTALSFLDLSAPDGPKAKGFPKDGLWSGAHVQAIGNQSGWTTGEGFQPPVVAVPVPTAAWGGLSLCCLVGALKLRTGRSADSALG